MDRIIDNWSKNSPKADKQKIENIVVSVLKFIEVNYEYDRFAHYFYDIDLCLEGEDESGSNGFWDATNHLVQQKYDIVFTDDNDEAMAEQQNLYDVLTCMRSFIFHKEMSLRDE